MPRLRKPLWWIKWTRFEYWPFMFLYFPTSLYWTYLILRSRSLTFFTLTNPPQEFGQFFGESKTHTLDRISDEYLPRTVPVRLGAPLQEARDAFRAAGLDYPLIIKPNWGERGVNVERVDSDAELDSYLRKTDRDSLIQEFIDYPIELGVFYHRFPDGSKSGITGVVVKEFMTVTGNGRSTVAELMEEEDRFRFQIKRLHRMKPELMRRVPAAGERLLLEPVGNHNRGTKFLDGRHHINDDLVRVFDRIAKPIEGFYYGRFDLKARSWEELYRGEGIRILELNGVYSEPAHIYDPGFRLLDAWGEIVKHMRLIYQIAEANRKRGYQPSSTAEFLRVVRKNYLGNKQVI